MKNLIVLVVLACAVAACGGDEGTPDGDWQLTTGIAQVDGVPITMSIIDTDVSGQAACNSYFGTVTVNGSAISFGEIGQTAMACPPEIMEAESEFLTMLGLVESFDFAEDGLVLETPQGDLVFHPAR